MNRLQNLNIYPADGNFSACLRRKKTKADGQHSHFTEIERGETIAQSSQLQFPFEPFPFVELPLVQFPILLLLLPVIRQPVFVQQRAQQPLLLQPQQQASVRRQLRRL